MPMELAERINEINDVDVFIHDFVDETNTLSNVTSLTQHPASRNSESIAFRNYFMCVKYNNSNIEVNRITCNKYWIGDNLTLRQ